MFAPTKASSLNEGLYVLYRGAGTIELTEGCAVDINIISALLQPSVLLKSQKLE
jgi:hypothetical protein